MHRYPLQSKAIHSNTNYTPNTSPLKRASPTKAASPTKRVKAKPTKQQQLLKSSTSIIPTIPFTIYRDPEIENLHITTPKAKKFTVFNDIQDASEKENCLHLDKENMPPITRSNLPKRAPLQDLNIAHYPSYMHIPSQTSKTITKQLNQPWVSNNYTSTKNIILPSYLTPPKKNRHVKYVTNMHSVAVSLDSKLSRTLEDIPPATTNLGLFTIHRD